ncbi:unnamed protein product [Tilletia caries]|uniref:Uncharacterized protein n=1 Tax=Tilletia caries TaxID=13290 RepID=A0A177UEC2_9BASI|nr:hypothetical protein CF335_g2558 [Tilletia laevis]KAE8252201.1 hypothetical protein A4X03_0g6232 [Tilletia caries]CAD6892777.1 unnamed protein product [Tilletia caries]CAD6957806.1 unnamed protein product [Tilletia caries]CAD6958823.1 unnamed protein product [Tilletia caries]
MAANTDPSPGGPLGSIKAVLFDMDGLLIDSESLYTDIVNEVLKPYGKEQTWEIKASLMGKPEREATLTLFRALWPNPSAPEGVDPACPWTVDEFLRGRNAKLEAAFAGVKPMPGAIRLVKHLAENDVPICVATGSKRLNYNLKSANNSELFDPFAGRVICGDDARLERGKPYPDVFLLAALEGGLKLDRELSSRIRPYGAEHDAAGFLGGEGEILVFEDGLPGVQAGLSAGMKVIWVPDPELKAIAPSAEKIGAHQVLDSLLEFKPEQWGLPAFTDK